jgi:pilus assembly protein Flp/PilA
VPGNERGSAPVGTVTERSASTQRRSPRGVLSDEYRDPLVRTSYGHRIALASVLLATTHPARWSTTGKEVITDMTLMQTWLSSLLHREEGQGLAEYALILALIAIVAILALLFLGTQISTILHSVGNAV